MKAIVLTFDKYVNITDHMIQTYQTLWPTNPFRFRVPYQQYPGFLSQKYGPKVELVPAREAIKATMADLLEDVAEEEWVYWCVDDKYLIRISEEEANKTYRWVREIDDPAICGVAFCRCRGLLLDANLFPDSRIGSREGQVFIERRNYNQIWLHQFLRAGILKELFRGFPDRPFRAKEMDNFIVGKRPEPGRRLFVTEKNLVVLGESTSRGKLTPNCVESFKKLGLEVPEGFEVHKRGLILGELPGEGGTFSAWLRRWAGGDRA